MRSIGKSEFRFSKSSQSNAKSENGFHREIRPQDGFQLRNQNPDFMDLLLTGRLGNPKKDFQNYSREQWSSFCYGCVRVQDRCSYGHFFKSFFGFPNRTVKMKIQKQISQRWNPFSDFAFDCKSKIRILKSKSRFPNRTQPKHYSCNNLHWYADKIVQAYFIPEYFSCMWEVKLQICK